jgi:hypothetical protein
VVGLFIALAAGLAVYGVTILAAVKAGVWFNGTGGVRTG